MISKLLHHMMMKSAVMYFVTPSWPLLLESYPDGDKPADEGDEPTQPPPRDDEGFEEVILEDEDIEEEDIGFPEEEELEVEELDLSEEEAPVEEDWSLDEEAFAGEGSGGEGGIDDIP